MTALRYFKCLQCVKTIEREWPKLSLEERTNQCDEICIVVTRLAELGDEDALKLARRLQTMLQTQLSKDVKNYVKNF